jgi:hypothetical protein
MRTISCLSMFAGSRRWANFPKLRCLAMLAKYMSVSADKFVTVTGTVLVSDFCASAVLAVAVGATATKSAICACTFGSHYFKQERMPATRPVNIR